MIYLKKINTATGIFIEDTFEIDLLEDGSQDPQYSYIKEPIPDTIYAPDNSLPKWTGSEWIATAEPPEIIKQPPSEIEKLEAKITAAGAYTDFLEELVFELAMQVYE